MAPLPALRLRIQEEEHQDGGSKPRREHFRKVFVRKRTLPEDVEDKGDAY